MLTFPSHLPPRPHALAFSENLYSTSDSALHGRLLRQRYTNRNPNYSSNQPRIRKHQLRLVRRPLLPCYRGYKQCEVVALRIGFSQALLLQALIRADMRAMGEEVLGARVGGRWSKSGEGESSWRTTSKRFSEAQTNAQAARPCARDGFEAITVRCCGSLAASDRSQMV